MGFNKLTTRTARKERLLEWRSPRRVVQPQWKVECGSWKDALRKLYGGRADSIRHAEAFESTEYGSQPEEAGIRKLFLFFLRAENAGGSRSAGGGIPPPPWRNLLWAH